jgi:hypothetical protein
VGVTRQVFKHMLGLIDRLPHTDDPLVFIEVLFKLLVSLPNVEFTTADSPCKGVDKLATKDQ